MSKKRKPKTIGERTGKRTTWTVDPRPRVKPGKKGKSARYNRQKSKKVNFDN